MIHHHNAACSFLLFSLHGDDIQREDKSGNYVKRNVNHSHNTTIGVGLYHHGTHLGCLLHGKREHSSGPWSEKIKNFKGSNRIE